MNRINKELINLKEDARIAGREAAKAGDEHAQNKALMEAYGRNVKAAHEGAPEFGWDAYGMAQLLNTYTTKAFEKAAGRKIEDWDDADDED